MILPVEYMVNGMALGLARGLKGGRPGVGLLMLPVPKPLMRPLSAENI
jgi:hypothetical protein